MKYKSIFKRMLRWLFKSNFFSSLQTSLSLLFITILLLAASLAASLTTSNNAYAFPEMVRHRYVNCTACHISPTGGGILTPYGRELSNEVLSTWGREGEGAFLWGVLQPPAWLALGGDLRTLNMRKVNAPGSQNRFILMQADFEAAIHLNKLSIVGTAGIQDSAIYPDNRFISRRHYLLWSFTDHLSLRGGRFLQAYGINVPDHTLFIRQGLGWDQGQETYNLEGSYLGERFNLYVSGIFSRPDIADQSQEKGASTSVNVALADKYKIGASYFYGTSYSANRNVFGPHLILGFTPRFFLLSELDFQRSFERTAVNPQWGFANYQRLDYEVVQGLHLFVMQQFSRLNFGNLASQRDGFGTGIQFFPRPHFELLLQWERRRTLAVSNAYADWIYFMFHFYP